MLQIPDIQDTVSRLEFGLDTLLLYKPILKGSLP